jgi:nucleotide-binding universal stress UspA family protein
MIPEIKKILYATDLSENARYAFGYAACLSHRHGAVLTILHVMEELSPTAKMLIDDFFSESQWKQLRQEKESKIISTLRVKLEEFCEEARQKLHNNKFECDNIVVVTGHPVDQIIRHIDKLNPDIVVMGSRGHGVLADVTLGSVSRRVLRRSKKPVLIVRLPD